MKKLLLSGLAIAGSLMSFAQTIPNASFEDWSQEALFREIDAGGETFVSSAEIAYFEADTVNVYPTNGETTAYLANILYGEDNDTLEAFVLWGNPPNEGSGGGFPVFGGGFPYTTMATSINVRMSYKCDSASPCIVLAQFKKSGLPVGSYVFEVAGESAGFIDTTFSFSTPLITAPDTAVVGVTVNNLLEDDSPKFPGDFVELDYIRINNDPTSVPGGTLNDWKDYVLPELPDEWTAFNGPRDTVTFRSDMSTDGDYSLLLTTKMNSEDDEVISGIAILGDTDPEIDEAFPTQAFTTTGDYEFSFDYMYNTGLEDDSAAAALFVSSYNALLGSSIPTVLQEIILEENTEFETYTSDMFSVAAGDTFFIIFAPSIDFDDESEGTIAVGNKLWIDNVRFDIVTGLNPNNSSESFTVYPNPSSGVFKYNFNGIEGIEKVEVFDNSGRVLFQQIEFTGFDDVIDLSSEKDGVYQLVITSSNGVTTRQMLKQ